MVAVVAAFTMSFVACNQKPAEAAQDAATQVEAAAEEAPAVVEQVADSAQAVDAPAVENAAPAAH